MTASPGAPNWTGLLAGAVAHDINNFVQGVSSARSLAGAPGAMGAVTAETEAIVEDDLEQLRKLGGRLRALASAARQGAATRLADACADAIAEVDGPLEQMRADSIPADLCVVGPAAAVTTAIASLMEHALTASPAGAAVSLTVRRPRAAGVTLAEGTRGAAPGSPVIVEIAAPNATQLGSINRARLDVVLASSLAELRGDAHLVLGGAIADAVGGAVYIASDASTGLLLALQLTVA